MYVRSLFGARSFSVAALTIKNSLPSAFQMCTSPDTFRHQLKTHYFVQTILPTNPVSTFLLRLKIQLRLTIVCVCKLYLLTYYMIPCCLFDLRVSACWLSTNYQVVDISCLFHFWLQTHTEKVANTADHRTYPNGHTLASTGIPVMYWVDT